MFGQNNINFCRTFCCGVDGLSGKVWTKISLIQLSAVRKRKRYLNKGVTASRHKLIIVCFSRKPEYTCHACIESKKYNSQFIMSMGLGDFKSIFDKINPLHIKYYKFINWKLQKRDFKYFTQFYQRFCNKLFIAGPLACLIQLQRSFGKFKINTEKAT